MWTKRKKNWRQLNNTSCNQYTNCFNVNDPKTRRDAGLVRSGRLFGGLINDIKRKKPHYLSDFRWQNALCWKGYWLWCSLRDALSMQSVSTIIFLYFANLAPIVAFGGLLGDATDNRMASIEALVGFVCYWNWHILLQHSNKMAMLAIRQ